MRPPRGRGTEAALPAEEARLRSVRGGVSKREGKRRRRETNGGKRIRRGRGGRRAKDKGRAQWTRGGAKDVRTHLWSSAWSRTCKSHSASALAVSSLPRSSNSPSLILPISRRVDLRRGPRSRVVQLRSPALARLFHRCEVSERMEEMRGDERKETNRGVEDGCEQLGGDAECLAEEHGFAVGGRGSAEGEREVKRRTNAVPAMVMPSRRLWMGEFSEINVAEST